MSRSVPESPASNWAGRRPSDRPDHRANDPSTGPKLAAQCPLERFDNNGTALSVSDLTSLTIITANLGLCLLNPPTQLRPPSATYKRKATDLPSSTGLPRRKYCILPSLQ